MLRSLLASVVIALLAACTAVGPAKDVVRIDATSAETAEASYRAMMAGRSEAQKQRLAIAVLVPNLEGVNSARDAVGKDHGNIGPIRNKVAGLSAEEIIALSATVKGPRIEIVEVAPVVRQQ